MWLEDAALDMQKASADRAEYKGWLIPQHSAVCAEFSETHPEVGNWRRPTNSPNAEVPRDLTSRADGAGLVADSCRRRGISSPAAFLLLSTPSLARSIVAASESSRDRGRRGKYHSTDCVLVRRRIG